MAAVDSAPILQPSSRDQMNSTSLSCFESLNAPQPKPTTSNNRELRPLNTNQARRSPSPRPGLSPVSTPLAILPSYVRQSSLETTLRLNRAIKKQYTIKTDHDEPIFHIDIHGHGTSYKTRTIYDARLRTSLLEIKERKSHHDKSVQTSVRRHSTDSSVMNVGEEQNGMIMGDFDNVAFGPGAKFVGGHGRSLYVKDEQGEGWALVGKSTIRSRADDRIVAIVRRSNDVSNLEYTVTIAPGVDMSLIVAFCVSMDFKWEKEERWTGERTNSDNGRSYHLSI